MGHGCPTLDNDQHRKAAYFVEGDSFYANLTCVEGHVFDDQPATSTRIVECVEFFWDTRVPHCIRQLLLVVGITIQGWIYWGPGPTYPANRRPPTRWPGPQASHQGARAPGITPGGRAPGLPSTQSLPPNRFNFVQSINQFITSHTNIIHRTV